MNLGHTLSIIYQTSSGQTRLAAMEGMRGVAVVLVFFAHFNFLFGASLREGSVEAAISRALGTVGHTGVDLFFIISGYLIYGTVIRKPLRYGVFLRRRVIRIYPAFLAVFVLYLAASALFPAKSRLPVGREEALVYILQNVLLLPGIFDIPALNAAAWTLSYEFFYYLLIPLMVAVFGMRAWAPRLRPLFLGIILAAYIAGRMLLPEAVAGWWPVHFRLSMFVAGIALFELLATHPALPHGGNLLALGLFPASLIPVYFLNRGSLAIAPPGRILAEVVILLLSFSLFTLYALGDSGVVNRLLSLAPLRWLGNMSYSYYLIHGITLQAAALIMQRLAVNLPGSVLFWFGIPVTFLLTLLSATVLFILIEKPLSLSAAYAAPRQGSSAPSARRAAIARLP